MYSQPASGKVVLIVGGTGGMGMAAAERFLRSGAKVFISGSNQGKLDRAVAALQCKDAEIHGICCDVRYVSRIERMMQEVDMIAGGLDVLINAAGVWVEGDSAAMTEEMWDNTVNINLKGTFFTASRAIPLLEKTRGCIINIASDAGVAGNKGAAIYCASKGGVVLLTKALSLELAPKGIRVVSICPADVDTPMIHGQARDYGNGDPEEYFKNLLSHYPQEGNARFIKSEEIAELIYYLASPLAAPITGAAISIDFGTTAGY